MQLLATILFKNIDKNDKFYGEIAFPVYSERVNFRSQSWKTASKQKPK